jgi:hypothetical protein
VQYLLDFIYEHTIEEQLYLVVESAEGVLELRWQRHVEPGYWQVRPKNSADGPWQLLLRADMLRTLEARRAEMASVERALLATVMSHIALAEMVLRDANRLLGRDLVQRAVQGHQDFANELNAVVARLTASPRPSMQVLPGGGAQSELRSGHLTLVS